MLEPKHCLEMYKYMQLTDNAHECIGMQSVAVYRTTSQELAFVSSVRKSSL